MILCPVCGAELEALILEDMVGKEFQQTLRCGRKDEPVFFCSNATPCDGHGMNLWTATSIKNWVAMQERLEKMKARI